MTLEAPVAYQGGKTRIAEAIADLLLREGREQNFYDLCCGCGAVSLALVNKGITPDKITMIDIGPWGEFWMRIGAETFSLDYFASLIDMIPKDPKDIRRFMSDFAKREVDHPFACYGFLVLQAASFGAKPVSIDGSRWIHHGFRGFWLPTATSNRRSHVNPMMPMPETLLTRVQSIAQGMKDVTGLQQDVTRHCYFKSGSVVYVDPPYLNLCGYGMGGHFDVVRFARQVADEGCVCFVSESRPIGEETIRISEGRKKGGVSGKRGAANEEWISVFRPAKVRDHV